MNLTDGDNACKFRRTIMIFHLSNEIPTKYRQNHDIQYLNHNEGFYIELGIKSYRMNMDLKPFPVELRRCYFEDERKLKFFKLYSPNHCKLECLANITLEEFGCVKFFMPRDSKTRICKFSELHKMVLPNEDVSVCECLPLCNDIKFNFKIDKAPLSNHMINQDFVRK
jgi:amiloride-sensitive sodium channel